MTRASIIAGLKRTLVQRVPRHMRAEIRLLLAAIEDQYAAVMSTAESEAYQNGLKAHPLSDDTGYRDGWARGYENAVKDVIGRTGSPAQPQPDDDILSEPTPPLAS